MSWNHATSGKGAGLHEDCLALDPKDAQSVLDFQCLPVVEEHQFTGPEAPEFVISVKWQQGNLGAYLSGGKSMAPGWRYMMRWRDWRDQQNVASGYGFASEQAAREAAEAKATKIVKAQQPEKVYTFRPDLGD